MRNRTVSLGLVGALLASMGVSAFEAVTLADYSREEIFVRIGTWRGAVEIFRRC